MSGGCLTLWAMADSLNVVAIRVNDIPAVVVGVIARAETKRTIVPSASGKGRGVEGIDGRAVWRCVVGDFSTLTSA